MHAVTRPVHFPLATQASEAPMPAMVPQQSSVVVLQVSVPHIIVPDEEPPDEEPDEEPDEDPDEEPDEDPDEEPDDDPEEPPEPEPPG
jgi:hypothetical protein